MPIVNFSGNIFGDDVDKFVKRLNSVQSEISRRVSKEIITHIAEYIRNEARKRAPIDTGALESSIAIQTSYGFTTGGGGGYRGVVFVSSGSKAGNYAEYMHEFFYELGPKSQAKQSSQPEKVGRKYLERAVYENTNVISGFVIARLKEFFANGI